MDDDQKNQNGRQPKKIKMDDDKKKFKTEDDKKIQHSSKRNSKYKTKTKNFKRKMTKNQNGRQPKNIQN